MQLEQLVDGAIQSHDVGGRSALYVHESSGDPDVVTDSLVAATDQQVGAKLSRDDELVLAAWRVLRRTAASRVRGGECLRADHAYPGETTQVSGDGLRDAGTNPVVRRLCADVLKWCDEQGAGILGVGGRDRVTKENRDTEDVTAVRIHAEGVFLEVS